MTNAILLASFHSQSHLRVMKSFRIFFAGVAIVSLGFPRAIFSADAVLKAHDPIEIPNSKGGFDYLQVDKAKRRLLLDHTGNGTLDIIDLKTEKLLKQIKTGAAMGVAVDSKKNRYYVSVSKEKKFVIIDSEKLEAIDEMPLPGPGDALAMGPAGVNRVFVGHDDATDLWVIDPDAKKIVSTLKISEGPEYIVAEDDTSLLYMNIKSDDTLLAISASDNNSTIGGTWPTAPAKKPHGLALDLRTPRRLFVAGINGKLAVLDTSGKVRGSADMVTGVDQIAFDAAKDRLYCPSSNGKMTVFDTSGNSVKPLGDVATARGAKTVAVDPETHAVWLANFEGGKCYARKFTLAD
jgi:DNA-binding beta-propeller fold protein YncE